MDSKDWQVTIDFHTDERLGDETLMDVMDEYNNHAASTSLSPDGKNGSLTMTVESTKPATALTMALNLLSESKTLTEYDVTGFEVVNWENAQKRNRESLFPKVVGYAEIARMAGVSRQRAYCFPKIASFPKPVIETAQGALYSEDAVKSWVENRRTCPGRPSRTA